MTPAEIARKLLDVAWKLATMPAATRDALAGDVQKLVADAEALYADAARLVKDAESAVATAADAPSA